MALVLYIILMSGHVPSGFFRLMSDEKVKLIGDERYHIIQDVPRGLIWISTYGNGLFVYDSQKGGDDPLLVSCG